MTSTRPGGRAAGERARRPQPRGQATAARHGAPALLICSSGGHLTQLYALRPWLESRSRIWVTENAQHARSVLDGERIIWGHFPTTRHIPNLVRNAFLALRLTMARSRRPRVIISTGAGLAVPFFVLGWLLRIPTVYIEVVDRVEKLTLTARICRRFTSLFLVQAAEQRALCPEAVMIGSLLGGSSAPLPGSRPASRRPRGAVAALFSQAGDAGPDQVLLLTLGTGQYSFSRLVGWIEKWLAEGGDQHVRLVVQHGATPLPPGPGRTEQLGYLELQEALQAAAIVVTHAGAATIMESRAAGHMPIVVPRRPELSEVVDGHQIVFSRKLRADQLAEVCDTEQELRAALDRAAERLSAPVPDAAQATHEAQAQPHEPPSAPAGPDRPAPATASGASRAGELIDSLLTERARDGQS